MKKHLLVFILAMFANDIKAYRFICNSIDANNNVTSDKCGACNDESGPRWRPADVGVHVDDLVLPDGINKQKWLDLVLSSLESWNKVPGANIKLRHIGSVSKRTVGQHPDHHEIFWIKDKAEWRQKVGGGENDTLGVTLSPYTCPNNLQPAREIFDADLVMNSVGDNFKWSINCASTRKCDSIRSTLTHELGHFVGLGHPCAYCSSSVMTAKAGYHIEYPMFDDQEGLRALYPGQSSGELGSRCDVDSECDGFGCIQQNDIHYCSAECSRNQSCPVGFACADYYGNDICQFAIGRLAGAVGLGESCITQPCEENLLCAGSNSEEVYCLTPCNRNHSCGINETCIPLVEDFSKGVCIGIATLKEPCGPQASCHEKLLCVEEEDNKRFCRAPCMLGKEHQCGIGEICIELENKKGACIEEKPVKKPADNLPDKGSSTWWTCSCVQINKTVSWGNIVVMAIFLFGLAFTGSRLNTWFFKPNLLKRVKRF